MAGLPLPARAAAWLRACGDWVLRADHSEPCPGDEQPFSLAAKLDRLAPYLQHQPGCAFLFRPIRGPARACTCGLDALLAPPAPVRPAP